MVASTVYIIDDHHPILQVHCGEPTAPALFCKCINFYSKVFLFPFNIKWVKRDRRYKLITLSPIRKFICASAFLGNLLMLFSWVQVSMPLKDVANLLISENGIIIILACLLMVSIWCTLLQCYYIIWFKHKQLVEFFNHIADLVNTAHQLGISSFHTNHFQSPFIWLPPILFHVLAISVMIVTIPGRFTLSMGSKLAVDWVAKICFLEYFPVCQGVRHVLQIFFKIIIILGSGYACTIQAVLVTLTISLRQVGKQLENALQDGNYHHISHIFILYEKISYISTSTNFVFANLVLTAYLSNTIYIIQTPMWWIIGLNDPQPSPSFHETLSSSAFVVFAVMIWWLAGEWHRLVHSSFNRIIQRLGMQIVQPGISLEDRLKLATLSNALNSEPIALSCKYFAITHHFTAKVTISKKYLSKVHTN